MPCREPEPPVPPRAQQRPRAQLERPLRLRPCALQRLLGRTCFHEMLAEVSPNTRVLNLETGYQFPETLELRERIREKFGIEVEYVRAQ